MSTSQKVEHKGDQSLSKAEVAIINKKLRRIDRFASFNPTVSRTTGYMNLTYSDTTQFTKMRDVLNEHGLIIVFPY